MSGIGKGIATASIASLLEERGYNVTAAKIDPYINVDAGTMNPVEHGEVFVTEDGLECDQDIGNYERFLHKNILRANYMTTGLVYQTVINNERALKYDGKCVEVVPHIPEEVIRRIKLAARRAKADFMLIEIGGTVGEYQNILFLEAARMMKIENTENVKFILVSYLPTPSNLGEMKTKPTQYAVRTLNSAGIRPNIILARADVAIDEPRKKKLSVFCNVKPEDIISAPNVGNIYEVPVNFERDNLTKQILKKFNIKARKNGSTRWVKLNKKIKRLEKTINIGIVGKYFETGKFVLKDSYISVIEAIKHASWDQGMNPVIHWIDSKTFERQPQNIKELSNYNGIIVPGGFGSSGIDGKLKTINYVRRYHIPFFGLCYGLQLALVEIAQNTIKLKNANTTEIQAKTPHPIIHILPEQKKNIEDKRLGGSMRLGAYKCKLTKNTIAQKAYGKNIISERHRHRYEFNNDFKEQFEKAGVIFSGINPERNLIEIAELTQKDHPFFLGTQFHPEFKSRPFEPHPLFVEFIKAAIRRKNIK